ncbi:MAG TPA: ABC transporter permease, partial [Terriglobales bacterium]
MTGLVQDVRFALRRFRKNPGFTCVAILTLALGIGASTVIFSVVYNGVLYPFPYRSAERLTAIGIQDLEHQDRGSRGMFHLDEVAAFRSGNHTFEDILAYGMWDEVYSRRSGTEMLAGVGATPNAMEFWGMPPFLGRGFTEQDVVSGATPVVLLNYRFWNREFHGDKNVLGTTMMLNGKARTIIGVMPPRFQAVGSDVYMPLSWTRAEPAHGRFENVDDPMYFWATGILKSGVNFETAAADIDVIVRQTARIHVEDYPKNFRVTMRRLNDVVVMGSFKQTLLLLFAAVGLLLFISCSNVAGLLLAHASARTKEIALRAALGAGRHRLVRQLLSESLVLAAAGCLLGCVFAHFGLKGLVATQLSFILPWEAAISLNRPVLFFAVGISLLATLLCGLAPAVHAVGRDLQKGLASAGVNVNAGFQHSRFRAGLVIGQVALSLIMLTSAGLLVKKFLILVHQDLGIQADKIFTADLRFPKGRYTKAEEKKAFFARFLSQVNSLPGVVSTTEFIGFPLLFAPRGDVTIPGKPHKEEWTTEMEWCSEGYFETFGLHLIHGRLLTAEDVLGSKKVAVVNEALARKYFGGDDPIGRQIKFNQLDQLPETPHDAYFDIVGVVSNARNFDFRGGSPVLRPVEGAEPQMFVPYSISGFGDRSIAMSTRVPPTSLVNGVRQILWSMDQDVVLAAPNINAAT